MLTRDMLERWRRRLERASLTDSNGERFNILAETRDEIELAIYDLDREEINRDAG